LKKSTNKSKKPGVQATAVFDIDLVKQFSEFMKAQDLSELELKVGGHEIKLRRGSVQTQPVQFAAPVSVAAPSPGQSSSAAAKSNGTSSAANANVKTITSPFVGTFYRAAGPNQDSFVEEGKKINAGDTLCIVEAMKLMNEIESDVKGRVAKVLVENGTPVEFGEPLFEIDAT
jgi:acetyl-CoA carboxylase biotin carboxyl carrier protein